MTNSGSKPDGGATDVGERVIIDFLRSHPDFFERHPEILAELQVPHSAGAASLIERQVAVLRDQRAALAERLDELYATARENQALADQFHRLLLELLEAQTIPEIATTLSRGLRLHCDADAVTLVIFAEPPSILPESLQTPVSRSAEARERLKPHLFAVHADCGPLAPELAVHLFPEQSDAMTSAALVPLALGPDFPGVLVVGSTDPERFVPDQGTLFLEQLGEAAACALRPHLATASRPGTADQDRQQGG